MEAALNAGVVYATSRITNFNVYIDALTSINSVKVYSSGIGYISASESIYIEMVGT